MRKQEFSINHYKLDQWLHHTLFVLSNLNAKLFKEFEVSIENNIYHKLKVVSSY